MHVACLSRRLLFTDDSVLLHEEGKGQDAFKWHKRSIMQSLPLATPTLDPKPAKQVMPLVTCMHTSDECSYMQCNGNKMAAITCSSYFIEPMEWMDQLEGNVTGKVLHPHHITVKPLRTGQPLNKGQIDSPFP